MTVGAEWYYYNLFKRERISERGYRSLRGSLRPIRPVNYPTRFDHEVEAPGWEEGGGRGTRYVRVGGKVVDLS